MPNNQPDWEKSLIINLMDDGFNLEGAEEYVAFVKDFVLPSERNRLLEEVKLVKPDWRQFTESMNAPEAYIAGQENGYIKAIKDLEEIKKGLRNVSK